MKQSACHSVLSQILFYPFVCLFSSLRCVDNLELYSFVPTFSFAHACKCSLHLSLHTAPSRISRDRVPLWFNSVTSLHWHFSESVQLKNSLSLPRHLCRVFMSCFILSPLFSSSSLHFYHLLSLSSPPILSLLFFPSHVPGLFSRDWAWPNSPLLRLMEQGLGTVAVWL